MHYKATVLKNIEKIFSSQNDSALEVLLAQFD